MQYHVWGKMIHGGIRKSTTDLPTNSMFKRCGSESSMKISSVKEATVDAVQQIASAITIPHQGIKLMERSSSASPSRLIDGQSKCYKQLAELKNLKDSGIISESEFQDEHVAILQLLKKSFVMTDYIDVHTYSTQTIKHCHLYLAIMCFLHVSTV